MRALLSALCLLCATSCAERVIEGTASFDPTLDPDPNPDSDPDPDPDGSSSGNDSWPSPRVIYLNFTGPTLVFGVDDSRTNTSTIIELSEQALEPYGAPETIPEITAFLREAWYQINVVFTTERPGGGDYTMVVVTPTNLFEPHYYGVTVIDCGDTHSNAIVAAFSEGPDGPRTPEVVASSISREVALSFGLDKIENPDDFVAEGSVPGRSFVDSCSPVGEEQYCPDTDLCPPGSRNSLAQLIELTFAE